MIYRHTITFAGTLPVRVLWELAELGFTLTTGLGGWQGELEPSGRLVCVTTQPDLRGVARRIAREANQTCVLYERDTLDKLSGLIRPDETLPEGVSEYVGGHNQ